MAGKSDETGGAATLDLNAVWRGGISLLRENWQLIATVLGVFVLLPSAAMQFALPPDTDLEGPLGVLVDTTSSPDAQQRAAQALGQMLLPFLGTALVSFLIAHLGYAAVVTLMGRARPTVGQALMRAAQAILPLTIALVVYIITVYAVIFILQLVLSPLGQALAAFLGSIVGVLAGFFLTARLAITLPVIALEGVLNPLKALARSWKMTAINPGNAFGFWMILGVAWFVTLMVQSIISIALVSIPGISMVEDLVTGLLSGLFTMVWGAIYCAMGVSMFYALRQIAPPADESDVE